MQGAGAGRGDAQVRREAAIRVDFLGRERDDACSSASADAPSSPPRKKRRRWSPARRRGPRGPRRAPVRCSDPRRRRRQSRRPSRRGLNQTVSAELRPTSPNGAWRLGSVGVSLASFAKRAKPARTRAPRSSSWSFSEGTAFQVYISRGRASGRVRGLTTRSWECGTKARSNVQISAILCSWHRAAIWLSKTSVPTGSAAASRVSRIGHYPGRA